MNNKIESIIADAEWWIDALETNKDVDAMHDFVQFCYKFMPALLAEIKRLHVRKITMNQHKLVVSRDFDKGCILSLLFAIPFWGAVIALVWLANSYIGGG